MARTDLPTRAAALLGRLDEALTAAWVGHKRRRGRLRPVAVLAFRGHVAGGRLHLRGRVLEEPGITRGSDTDPWWRNLAAMARRFASVEIPGATVRVAAERAAVEGAAVEPAAVEVRTDARGYFVVDVAADPPAGGRDAGERWLAVDARVLDPLARGQDPDGPPARGPGAALGPAPDARFAVVSDVDDTVITTGLTGGLTAARIVLLNNARTRVAFPGVAAFYRALREGPVGSGTNPLFFVSGGPWNLYDLVVEFLDHHGVPPGPLLLTEWTLDPRTLGSAATVEHKREQIARLLDAYPSLPFVLIGDSGQHDPEIYRHVVADHPGRVAAVYIRDVTEGARDATVAGVATSLAAAGVPMVVAADTAAAARHAAEVGLIDPAALPAIERDRRADRWPVR